MARNDRGNLIGSWAFLIGVILAVLVGLFGGADGISSLWIGILVIIGLIVGLFNIATEEVTPFLMAGAVLIIAAGLGQNVMNEVAFVEPILNALMAIFVPATVIVALKSVFQIARH